MSHENSPDTPTFGQVTPSPHLAHTATTLLLTHSHASPPKSPKRAHTHMHTTGMLTNMSYVHHIHAHP